MKKIKQSIILSALGIGGYLGKQYFSGGVCNIERDLSGQVVLITGGNSGIGKETALELAKKKATVIIASRNLEKSQEAIQEIQKLSGNNNVFCKELDLNDLQSVKKFGNEFVQQYERLDILINNAGIYSRSYKKSAQDIEQNFAVNHLGHYLLTQILYYKLLDTKYSRIINVSCGVHRVAPKVFIKDKNDTSYFDNNYQSYKLYPKSKLAVALFTKQLQKNIEADQNNQITTKTCYVNPGKVRTGIVKNEMNKDLKEEQLKYIQYIEQFLYPFLWYFTKSPKQGSQTTLHCALMNFDQLQGGNYYEDCQQDSPSHNVKDVYAEKLWELSENLVKEFK